LDKKKNTNWIRDREGRGNKKLECKKCEKVGGPLQEEIV
jgi:hypothetical protein